MKTIETLKDITGYLIGLFLMVAGGLCIIKALLLAHIF